MITDVKALSIYKAVTGHHPLSDEEQDCIEEIRTVLDLPTVEDAIEVVTHGWGSSDEEDNDITERIYRLAGKEPKHYEL